MLRLLDKLALGERVVLGDGTPLKLAPPLKSALRDSVPLKVEDALASTL